MKKKPASAPRAFASDVNSIFSFDAKLLLTSTSATGAPRIQSTGSWTGTTVASVRSMLSTIWPTSAAWLSISYPARTAPKSAFLPDLSEPVGKLTTSRKFSPNKMFMPCQRCLNLFSVQGILSNTRQTSRKGLSRNKSRAAPHHRLFRHIQTSS